MGRVSIVRHRSRARHTFSGLLIAALMAGAGSLATLTPAAAASCVVNNSGDAGAANPASSCDTSVSGQVTLRSAMEHFNSVGTGDNVITFNLPNPTTIQLTSNTPLVANGAGSLTITGGGPSQTLIDGRHLTMLFSAIGGGGIPTLNLQGLTLENGQASGTAVAIAADVNFTNVKITGSVATGGGVSGGICECGAVTMTGSSIDQTTADAIAGHDVSGALFSSSSVSLTDTMITNTEVTVPTGRSLYGLFETGNVTMTRSSISGTTATVGDTGQVVGGIANSATVTMDHSSIGSLSVTLGSGGTIVGALFNTGTVTLGDSTIGANNITAGTETTVHGALFNSGNVGMTNVTFAKNIATFGSGSSNGSGNFNTGAITLKNTIISGNGAANCATAVASADHSLDSDSTCGFGASNGNINGQDPKVGAMQVNAPGATQTMAIDTTSPAYNTANNANCPTDDQRGVTRLTAADTICDMGAYEFIPEPASATAAVPNLPKAGHPASSTFDWRLLLLLGLVPTAAGAAYRGLRSARKGAVD